MQVERRKLKERNSSETYILKVSDSQLVGFKSDSIKGNTRRCCKPGVLCMAGDAMSPRGGSIIGAPYTSIISSYILNTHIYTLT